MRILSTFIALAFFFITSHTKAESPAITVGVDFNSSYVFHGMTYNKGAVAQPYMCIAGKSFIYNMWCNYNLESDDNGLGHFEANEFTEIDHFFTYLLPVSFVNMDATFGMYTYPALGWPSDKELQLGAEKTIHSLLVPFARVGYMIDGAMEENLYVEFGSKGNLTLAKPLSLNYSVKASWEKQPFIPGTPSGMKHLLATVGLTWMANEKTGFVAKANYVGQFDKDVMPDALYDVDFHASIGVFTNF